MGEVKRWVWTIVSQVMKRGPRESGKFLNPFDPGDPHRFEFGSGVIYACFPTSSSQKGCASLEQNN